MLRASLIVTRKPDGGQRDRLWEIVKERHERLFPDVELVVGENNDEYFNKSKATNDAIRVAKTDNLILCDGDVYFDRSVLCNILNYINYAPWVIPFDYGYRLTEETTEELIGRGLPSKVTLNTDQYFWNTTSPGAMLSAMKRSAYEAIGGLDERFQGWGCEDEAMAIALDTIVGPFHRIPGKVYHLYHSKANTKHAYYLDNVALRERYREQIGNKEGMLRIIKEHQQ
jgi:glycosyltransferase involved in cell wall biosynthesis